MWGKALAVLAMVFWSGLAQGAALHWSRVEEALPLRLQPGGLALAREAVRPEDESLEALFLPAATGEVRVELREKKGEWKRVDAFPADAGKWVFLSVVPDWAALGGDAALRLVWAGGQAEVGFAVQKGRSVATSGKVPLRVPNPAGMVSPGALPFTVGVPFPPGALSREENVVLRDAQGREVPLQTRVLARWAPKGAIRWLLCDFVAPVTQRDEPFVLEYGPTVRRKAGQPPVASKESKPPEVEAFVEDEAGHRFVSESGWKVEESGPVKTVLHRAGEYRAESGATFCRYVTRMSRFRNSPVVRLQHTWIFTGNAYHDRIRQMGVRIASREPLHKGAFSLTGRSDWAAGQTLVQLNGGECEWVEGDVVHRAARASGLAMGANDQDGALFLGVADFWQNFPQQLSVEEGGLTFYQWPKDRKRSKRPFTIESANQLWFAHEGELLDFAVPRDYVTPPLVDQLGRHRLGDGKYLETVNAQGIAKTDDLLIWPAKASERDAVRAVHEGVASGELRAVVDPAWLAASGVFHEIHPKDTARFPQEEAVYELHARAPYLWVERLGFFGKWIHGDMTWEPDLRRQTAHPYRAFRKMHQGWPYSWIPYARNGDARFYPFAQAALRHITDIAFCHYSDGAVPTFEPSTGKPLRARPRGFYKRFHIPWGSQDWDKGPTTRGYIDKADFLLQGYYLTGDARVRDVLEDWGRLIKTEGNGMRGLHDESMFQTPETPADLKKGDWVRTTATLVGTFTDLYQATFDPWFLAAARQTAEAQLGAWRALGWKGQFWNPGYRDYLRFSRSAEYQRFYLDYADHWTSPETAHIGDHYPESYPMIEPAAFAYELTGDPRYLRRVRHFVDEAREATYDGLPAYNVGMRVRGVNRGAAPQYTGYFLQHLPLALHALAKGGPVEAEHNRFFQLPTAGDAGVVWEFPRVKLRKQGALPLSFKLPVLKAIPGPWEVEVQGPGWQTRKAWEPMAAMELEIPADAPEGEYEVAIRGKSAQPFGAYWKTLPGVYFPLSPGGTPEVFALDAKGWVGPAYRSSRYAFRVPEGKRKLEFRCRFVTERAKDCTLVRVTLWNRAGKCVGRFQADRADLSAPEATFTVEVPETEVGEIWELVVTHPHAGVGFDKAIAPWVAAERGKWFQP